MGSNQAASSAIELSDKRRAFAGYMLTVSYGVQYVGEFFCRQTKEQLWINLYVGDTVALGLIRGQIYSVSQILGFLITPMLGGLSDSFGRRPVLIFGSILYQVATLTVLSTGASLPGLVAYEIVMPIAARAMGLPNRAGFGDLFQDEPILFTKFMAIKELIIPAAKIMVPIFGGLLARRSIMLPFKVTLAIGCINVLIPAALVPETLQPHKRKPFNVIKSLNPLSAIKLFTHGRKLAVLSTMSLIDTVSETCAGPAPAETLCELHRVHLLGWDTLQRGRWESINSIFRTAGIAFTTGSFGLIERLGFSRALDVALLNYIAQALWLSSASKPWHFYAALPCYLLKLLRDTVQVAAVQTAGQEAGFGNGEITGMIYNAQTVVGVLAPMPWAWVYGLGMAYGRTGLFYLVIAGFTTAKLLLSHTVSIDSAPAKNGAA
jgi:DHA1 family tetracycline resistance protein-like MFS transporter